MQPYSPQVLPLASLDYIPFIRLIGPAQAELARFDGILRGIVNPGVLLSPLTTQEAVLSSRIEGTQSTLEEVLVFEASKKAEPSKKEDIREIINYRQAMSHAVTSLKKRPISLNLLLEMHGILMDSVRGYNKGRGRFRRVQNWIGKQGAPIEEAIFIPPAPAALMGHLDNFEKYVHHDEADRLVQLAIIHAQFELIHPFVDGNGRLGRILIPLFLFEKNLLGSPMFYISAFFERNRETYYDRLKSISSGGDWNGWITFFLNAVLEQARINQEKVRRILALYNGMKEIIPRRTHSQFSINTMDTLFIHPIFSTTDFIRRSKIPKASAIRILNKLRNEKVLEILKEGRGKRPTIYVFRDLLGIVQGS